MCVYLERLCPGTIVDLPLDASPEILLQPTEVLLLGVRTSRVLLLPLLFLLIVVIVIIVVHGAD